MVFVASLGLGLAVGCGDDGGAESGTGAGSSEGSSSGSGPTSTSTMTMTPTVSGTADTTEGMTATEDTTMGMMTMGESTEGMTSTTGDTEGSVCEGLGRDQCMATDGCMAIAGSPIMMMDGGACLGPVEYIECQMAIGCGDAITYACAGDDAPLYEFPDTCTPASWIDCGKPPGVVLEPCP